MRLSVSSLFRGPALRRRDAHRVLCFGGDDRPVYRDHFRGKIFISVPDLAQEERPWRWGSDPLEVVRWPSFPISISGLPVRFFGAGTRARRNDGRDHGDRQWRRLSLHF